MTIPTVEISRSDLERSRSVSRDGIRFRLIFLRIRFEIFDTDCDTCLVSIPRSVEPWLISENRFLSSRRLRRYLSDVSKRFKTYAEYHVRLIVSKSYGTNDFDRETTFGVWNSRDLCLNRGFAVFSFHF